MSGQKPSATSSEPAVNQFREEMKPNPPPSVSWTGKPSFLSRRHPEPINPLNTNLSLRANKDLPSMQPRE